MSSRENIAKSMYARYLSSDMTSLDMAYGKFSDKKMSAWKYCEDLMKSKNGRNLKVISYNTNVFSAGFEFEDPTTGVCKFMYITKGYDTEVEIDESMKG